MNAQRNPRTFTAKGERMYEEIKRGYGRDPQAQEIAARTVYARAAEGAPGLVKARNADDGDLDAKTHKDVEFHVEPVGLNIEPVIVQTWNEAAGLAVSAAASRGVDYSIDTGIYSHAGANWYAGDEGVEQYDEDPDASVFDRIVISVDWEGRIP